MEDATETEPERITLLDASLVDEELSELLALADEVDSWHDWLMEHSGSSGVEPISCHDTEHLSSAHATDSESTTDSHDDRLDRRRRLNREAMARSRSQKRESLETLSTQEAALHRILLQMLAHKKPIHVDGETKTRLQSYQARVTELVRAREQLMTEKQRLTEELRNRSQRVLAMELMLQQRLLSNGAVSAIPSVAVQSHQTKASHTRPTAVAETAVESLPMDSKAGRWLQFLEAEPPLYFENLDANVCASIVRQNLQAIECIHQDLDKPSGVLYTAQCLGWKLERTRETTAVGTRPLLRTRCVKRIPRSRASIEEIQDRAWELLSVPENISRVNNGSIKGVVAQHVDDDTVVLLRNSPDKTDHKLFRYFSLNTRRWTNHSAVVLMIVLDTEAQPRVPFFPGIKWMKQGCACLRFSHVGDEYTQLEYTATIECVSEEHAASVVVANCVALLKWEQFVVPLWLLPL